MNRNITFPAPGKLGRSLLAAALLAGSAPAMAQQAVQNVNTTSIYRLAVSVAPGATVTYDTRALSANADTVLHLWDDAARTELAFNDEFGGTHASSVTYTNPTAATKNLTLLLRSWSNYSQGTADIYRNGVRVVTAAPVGGTKVGVTCGAAYRIQTALKPAGASDTMLIGLDSWDHMRAFDDESGPGHASLLSGRTDLCAVVATTWEGAANGVTDVYVNDTWADTDADGLGNGLEAAVGTCAAPGCAVNPADTDRDGLRDDAELLGIDDASFPQELPKWGASARHKDVFVEVDYSDAFASQPFTGADAVAAQAYYDGAYANEVGNPDGLPGVRLHLDIGVNPTNPAQAGLYGSWGGVSRVPAAIDYLTAPNTYRAAQRNGLFHSALASMGNGGGQAPAPGDRLGWGVQVGQRYVASFAHELGHNLNLNHFGHADWGAVNCKPNYRSIMNYAFGGNGFTHGENFAVLNPAGLSETVGVGPGLAPSYLAGDAFYFGVSGDGVDWNRDGVYDTGVIAGIFPFLYARAAATWATWNSCGALASNSEDLANIALTSTPSLARRGNELFAFWVGTDSRVHYRHGYVGNSTFDGSCPGGDDLGADCMSWGADTILATSRNARGVSAYAWGGQLYVAYRSDVDSLRVLSSATADAAGNPTGWSAETWVGSAYTAFEPELGVMRVNPATYGGASEVLALLYRDNATTSYKWASASTVGGAWTSRGNVATPGGVGLTGVRSPSLASMGSGAVRETCGAFTQADNRVHVYCYDVPTNGWNERTTAFGTANWADNFAKPGFVYHIPRDLWGLPMHSNATEGQFQLTVRRSTGLPDLMVSSPLSSTRLPQSNLVFTQLGKLKDEWTSTPANVGVEAYEDEATGALKMLIDWGSGTNPLQFYPLADGSFSAQLKSGDDYYLMERGVCLGLRPEAWCGARTTATNGY